MSFKGCRRIRTENFAVELLNRLLKVKVKAMMRTNATSSKKFSEMLDSSIQKYNNKPIQDSKVIKELIQLEKEMQKEQEKVKELDLSTEEICFYDTLTSHETAKKVMEDKELRVIAHELTKTVRQNIHIDWYKRENSKSKMRAAVNRLLRKYGYPPDLEKEAVKHVVEQTELMAESL